MEVNKEYEEINDEELQELLSIKRTRAYMLTRQMSDAGMLVVSGRGQTKRYHLPEKK